MWKEDKVLELMDQTQSATCNPNEFMRCMNCHAPNPGPTRLADPNRFPGRETKYWDSLPDFFFFKTELVPVGMAHIL